jgi:hypothetical protein
MGEIKNKDVQTYPIKVVALQIGWLLNEEEGIDFLIAMNNSEKVELYELDAI